LSSFSSLGFCSSSGTGFLITIALGTNLSIFFFTKDKVTLTFVELLKVLPLGMSGIGLMRLAVLAALYNDNLILTLVIDVLFGHLSYLAFLRNLILFFSN
jgi:hypothetical protein